MATSTSPTTQYNSREFVESCGAVLFDFSRGPEPSVCLIHYDHKNEWLLAKGRRNCGESRHEAALREVREETGYRGQLYPVRMATRAPGAEEAEGVVDDARVYDGVVEPFMVTFRDQGRDGGKDVKIIWWYAAEVVDAAGEEEGEGGGDGVQGQFFGADEALKRLFYRSDREVLREAISIVKMTKRTG